MKLKLSISMLAVFFIWGMSLLYAFGQVDVDHDENEEGGGGGMDAVYNHWESIPCDDGPFYWARCIDGPDNNCLITDQFSCPE